MARRRRARGKAKTAAKVTFFGHEILLTFIGSLIISIGVMLALTGLQPAALLWLLSTVFIWLGLLIFLFPIIRKIEGLM